ncbi:hypothetical protein GF319_06725 [Candidatus Bathyarchaeota archaeon]|nr:hypothetical protein [Candidatus Bathyarchaeota archaeon]
MRLYNQLLLGSLIFVSIVLVVLTIRTLTGKTGNSSHEEISGNEPGLEEVEEDLGEDIEGE